jgi:hypothetical protein
VSIPEVSSRNRLLAFLQRYLKKLNALTVANYTFPTSDGTNTQVLTTDGNGTLTFENAGGGGSPAGSNTQVQFNDGGSFGASANLTFDGTDVGVAAKIFHVGDTDTYINFTDDDINIQAGGVNFVDFTQDTQNDVTFNEGGVDIDFRVETADESHMLFIEGSSNRMSIGDNTGSPAATLEVKNNASAGAYGVPLVQLNSNDTDEIALDINASNVDANVVAIAANSVTTAKVIQVSADALTTGNALYVDDDSSDTSARTSAHIIQNNAAAIAATALTVQSDGGATGVKIDKNYSDVTEDEPSAIGALYIDFDKTGASTSNNTMYGLNIDMDNTTATAGNNYMYGLYVTPTLSHAADVGGAYLYGAYIDAQGGKGASSLITGARIAAQGGVVNYGLQLDVEDGASNVDLRIQSSVDSGDFFQIQTTTHGATTITTVDDDASAADLTFTVDGDISLDATAGAGTTTITSDLAIGGDLTVSTAGSTIAQEAWTAPTLAGTWSNYGGLYQDAGYMKDSLGFIHLRGLLKAGGAGDTIFTLPAGYRPSAKLIFSVQVSDGGSYVHGRVDVDTDGTVDLIVPSTVASGDWVSLDGINFDTQS